MPSHCLLCGFKPEKVLVSKNGFQVLRCPHCELGFLKEFSDNPYRIYEDIHYYDSWWRDRERDEVGVRRVKDKTAGWVLDQIGRWVPPGGRLLEVGCAFGYFLKHAHERGYRVKGLDISNAVDEAAKLGFKVFHEPVEKLASPRGSFDVIVFLDVIEHLVDPRTVLDKCRELLDGTRGILVMMTPNVESLFCKALGKHWLHFKAEHLYYYSKKSLTKLLDQHGFEVLVMEKARKGTSFQYISAISQRFRHMPVLVNNLLYRLPFSSRPFLVPMDLFCIARTKRNVL